ncbi:MAG TPA: hypothetical protein VJV23_07755 [Candidatus Polarisedimenticolia bacterium]|nr:hypothetical protein [Candidatus Polarisedimenticolia bacterium]
MRRSPWIVPLLLATALLSAEEQPSSDQGTPSGGSEAAGKEPKKDPKQKAEEAKRIDGMSILGNQEAPKSLVIVPWKSSELGVSMGLTTLLDDSRKPVDRDVFLRALSYYEIRSGAR